MLLAIDIGNTNISLGAFQSKELLSTWRISTESNKTSDEYELIIRQMLHTANIQSHHIKNVSICSVVPPLTPTFEELSKKFFGVTPLIIGSGTKTGIKVLYDNPRDVGADRIVDAAAGLHLYGGPFIVVDLGTATVFDAVSGKGEYLGGAIAPGMTIAADYLFRSTSQLRRIELSIPDQAIGKNTHDALQSGLVLGYSDLIKGMITRIKRELSEDAIVIGTGGNVPLIENEVGMLDIIDLNLTLSGLRIIYGLNREYIESEF